MADILRPVFTDVGLGDENAVEALLCQVEAFLHGPFDNVKLRRALAVLVGAIPVTV